MKYVFCFAAGIAVGSAGAILLAPAFNQSAQTPVIAAPENPPAQPSSKSDLKRGETFTGRLKSIHDGDTFRMQEKDTVYNIRVWGIDAPELKQTCEKDSRTVECGKMAKAAMEKVLRLDTVSCEHLGMHQQRIIARCTVNGRDISSSLIRQGLALEDKENTKGRYSDDESYAKSKNLGLWSMTFDQPAHWRACNLPIPKNLRRPENCPK